jgi:hypothetical protein
MRRLGYTRYVAQGGDWGAPITDVMAVQAPPELIGMHTMAHTPARDGCLWSVTGLAPPPRAGHET